MNISELFGPVWDASGVRGQYGEGYWFHSLVPNLSFQGSTFVTKTMTSFSNKGNMQLRSDHSPLHLFPDCIYVDPLRGITLNAVGLSGPGAERLLSAGKLLGKEEPYLISWMPIGKQLHDQIEEANEFVRLMKQFMPFMLSRKVGIQLNVSCPNVGADTGAVLEKAETLLTILGELSLPIVVKLNLLVSPITAARIATHSACSGICITNTAPFGEVLEKEKWMKLFPDGSPLRRRNESYGDGGLSGPLLLPFVTRWVSAFRLIDESTHVNAGGGIWHANDVDRLKEAKASSIFIGTVAMLRPWRVRSIIERAHKVFV